MATAPLMYQVSAVIGKPAELQAYLVWLTNGHIADVVADGALSGSVVVRSDRGDEVVCVYRFASRAAFDRYEAGPAAALRAEGVALFGPESGRSITWTRMVGEVLQDTPASG